MSHNRRKRNRTGTASVEFAISAPVLFLVGFGFMNMGTNVQLKHNSKIIGHLAATELMKLSDNSPASIDAIESDFEELSRSLGMVGLSVDIAVGGANDIAIVETHIPVSGNSAIPAGFSTNTEITTETFTYFRSR